MSNTKWLSRERERVNTVSTHIKFENKNYYFVFKCLNKIWWDGSAGKGCQVYDLSSNYGTYTEEEESQSQVVPWPTHIYYGKHKEDKTENKERGEEERREINFND